MAIEGDLLITPNTNIHVTSATKKLYKVSYFNSASISAGFGLTRVSAGTALDPRKFDLAVFRDALDVKG